MAQGVAQGIVVAGVEAGAAFARGLHDVGIHAPVFGVLQAAGTEGVAGGVEILEEPPAVSGVGVHDHADLVVAEAVDVVFLEEKPGVVDEELADFGPGEGEAESTRRGRYR